MLSANRLCLTYDMQTRTKLKIYEKRMFTLHLVFNKFCNFALSVHLLWREMNFY